MLNGLLLKINTYDRMELLFDKKTLCTNTAIYLLCKQILNTKDEKLFILIIRNSLLYRMRKR